MYKFFIGLTRFSLGLIFLWAFFDKTFGLGYATSAESAWRLGASPTEGFLLHATKGPYAEIFQGLAGQVWVDWLFMIGLLLIGITLTFGIAVRLGSIFGALMLLLMYFAALPPEHHPIIDDHIVYSLILLAFAFSGNVGKYFGLGKIWLRSELVERFPILK